MKRVSRSDFIRIFNESAAVNPKILEACSPIEELPAVFGMEFYADENSGFVISYSGEITYLFSAVRGKGDSLVTEAIAHGGNHLDCFDGYLPKLYSKHGFKETHREANWTPREPDVVYMKL